MTLDPERQLQWLMQGVESLLVVLDRVGLKAWLDWGTLLGYARHRNVIPWDYDADLCMFEDDYARFMAYFAARGDVDGLSLQADYYGDAAGCCAILLPGCPDPTLGLDLVAYKVNGPQVQHLMAASTVATYPGKYDLETKTMLPLQRGWFLGRRAWLPACPEARIIEVFGDGWRSFPDGHVASRLTAAPLWEIPVNPPDEPCADAPYILRGTRDLRAQGYASPARLSTVRGGAWRKESRGTELLRVLDTSAVATLEARGIPLRSALSGSFTDAVWSHDGALWGMVGVGSLEYGDTLVMPEGCVARSVFEVTSVGNVRDEVMEPTCRP